MRGLYDSTDWHPSRIPEPSLDPPEDDRRVYGECVICEEDIMEYDDLYDIPSFGICCTRCIERARRIEVTID